MILVDYRTGSKHLAKPLAKRGIEVDVVTLKYGDVSFVGNGLRGRRAIGIELKTVTDLLSCMQTKRFTGSQLPGLTAEYDVVYLMIEGGIRAGSDGILEIPQRGGWEAWGSRQRWARPMMYRDLLGFLTTIETLAGVKIRRTMTEADTVEAIVGLHSWWSKSWDKHKSLNAIYDGERLHERDEIVPVRKAGFSRTIAAQLPGIGWKKSARVLKRFPTMEDMVLATPREWSEVDGIGKTLSQRIYKAIHEGVDHASR